MLRRNGKQSSCEPCRRSKISCDHTHPKCLKCQKRGRTAQCFYHPAPMTRRPVDLNVTPIPNRRETDGDEASIGILSPSSTTRDAPTRSDGFPSERAPAYEALRLSGSEDNVLQYLFPLSVLETMMFKYYEAGRLGCNIPRFVAINGLNQLREDLERAHALGMTLDELYDEIIENTKKPFTIPHTTKAIDFHKCFTGVNLRLEFIGTLYCLAGLAGESITDGKVAYFTHQEQATYTEAMRDASNACVHACKQVGAENEIMLWLLYCNVILLSDFLGDAHLTVWRQVGDVTSDLTSLGLHRNPDPTAQEPFYLSQLRKRIFTSVFRGDKSLATFLNRPPRITRQYCDFRLPLDVPEEVLTLEGAELDAALASLDENGWNTKQTLSSVTFGRVLHQLAIYRDEILELISCKVTANRDERPSQVLESIRRYWDSIPAVLRYDDGSWDRYPTGNKALWLLAVHLEYLHSNFLILRHLARSNPSRSRELFRVSMQILDGVMVVMKNWNSVRSFGNLFRDSSWTLLFFGLPSAAVLATEFRRCTYEGIPLDPTISRSKLIRNISVITASLEWTAAPSHRYLQQCKDACETLGSLLNDALDHVPPTTVGADANTNANLYTPLGDLHMEHDAPIDSDAFLAWLENMDWNRTMPTS